MSELTTEQIREALEEFEMTIKTFFTTLRFDHAKVSAKASSVYPAALRDLLAAREQNERLMAVLREVEYSQNRADERDKWKACPVCGWGAITGSHSPDCALDAAPKEGGG